MLPDGLIPDAFRHYPHAATRHLYFWEKPGHVTCIFQPHPRSKANPIRLVAYPEEIENNPDTATRMSKTIYAMSYVVAGRGTVKYEREGRTFRLEPGVFFQYSNHEIVDVVLDTEPGLLECSACVDGDTGRHLAEIAMWNDGVLSAAVGPRPSIVHAYRSLYESIGDPASNVRSLLREFIQLAELFGGALEGNHPDRAFKEEARALLAANLAPTFRIEEAARRMRLTYESFRQRFKRCMGMSPQEFQLRLRMERACELLETHSVKETAVRLGYEDAFVFSRQFRKRLGVPPSRYRE